MGESGLRSIGGISNYQENENIEMGNAHSHWILHCSAVKDKRPVAQIYFTPEHCFPRCSAALFTHYKLEFHSISQTRPKIPGLRHANYPSGRLFSPSGYPKMLEGATREKFFLLLPKELTKKLLEQQAVRITPYIPPDIALLPTFLRQTTTSSEQFRSFWATRTCRP